MNSYFHFDTLYEFNGYLRYVCLIVPCCVIGLELYSLVEVEDFLAEEECVLRLEAVGCCLEECVFRFLVFGGSGFACRVFLFHQIE